MHILIITDQAVVIFNAKDNLDKYDFIGRHWGELGYRSEFGMQKQVI